MSNEPIVAVDVPTGHLTPSEARRLARGLEIIAAMVEDGAE